MSRIRARRERRQGPLTKLRKAIKYRYVDLRYRFFRDLAAVNRLLLLLLGIALILLFLTNPQTADAQISAGVTVAGLLSFLFPPVRKFVLGVGFGNRFISVTLVVGLLASGFAAYCIAQVPLEFYPSDGDFDIRVVVAEFEKTGTDYEPDIDMLEVLQEAADEVGTMQVIHYGRKITDREDAQRVSDQFDATMVVYGRVAPGGVTAKYEMSPRFGQVDYTIDKMRVAATDVENFESFLFYGLDVEYILGLSIGQMYLFDKQYEAALVWFSKAASFVNEMNYMNRAKELAVDILFFHIGLANGQLGNHVEAEASYTRSIDLNPQLTFAYNNRGIVRSALGNPMGAMADFNWAINLNPQFAEAYNNRGNVRSDLGNLMGASADYTLAIEFDPHYAAAYGNRGNVRSALGDPMGAIADFGQAIELDSKDAGAFYNRGIMRSALGDLAGAMADYDRAIELDPPFVEMAYNNRGTVRSDLGDLTGAIADFDQAIDLNPQLAAAYGNRGVARRRLGDLAGAVADYNQAIALDQQYAGTYLNLGHIYYDTEYYEQALAYYRKFLALAGENPNSAIVERVKELEAMLGE